jgi:hypothetical protein
MRSLPESEVPRTNSASLVPSDAKFDLVKGCRFRRLEIVCDDDHVRAARIDLVPYIDGLTLHDPRARAD